MFYEYDDDNDDEQIEMIARQSEKYVGPRQRDKSKSTRKLEVEKPMHPDFNQLIFQQSNLDVVKCWSNLQ